MISLCLFALLQPVMEGKPRSGCIEVKGDSIRLSDFAKVFPSIAGPAGEKLTNAPAAGVRRLVGSEEMRRMLSPYLSVPEVDEPVCFVGASRRLEMDELRTTLAEALPDGTAHLTLVDCSRYPIAEGRLEFPLSGLMAGSAAGPDTTVLWRGFVRMADRRTAPVWVRFKAYTEREQLTAAHLLEPGRQLRPEDVKTEQRRVFPIAAKDPLQLREVVGKTVKRRVAAGASLRRELLAELPAVVSGESVDVEVAHGDVHLRFPAVAEAPAKAGDIVWLRHPGSPRRFRARILGPGKAVVEVEKRAK